jgi:DNA-binding transcriptional ArsR family regulator
MLSCVTILLHMTEHDLNEHSGDQLLTALAALANPQRLRIIAALQSNGRNYVSQLARDIGISRPLLHLHLQRLEEAGLVTSQLELSQDGKALNYFAVAPFVFELTPDRISAAVTTLTHTLTKPDLR